MGNLAWLFHGWLLEQPVLFEQHTVSANGVPLLETEGCGVVCRGEDCVVDAREFVAVLEGQFGQSSLWFLFFCDGSVGLLFCNQWSMFNWACCRLSVSQSGLVWSSWLLALPFSVFVSRHDQSIALVLRYAMCVLVGLNVSQLSVSQVRQIIEKFQCVCVCVSCFHIKDKTLCMSIYALSLSLCMVFYGVRFLFWSQSLL